jgi:hypothetical protein
VRAQTLDALERQFSLLVEAGPKSDPAGLANALLILDELKKAATDAEHAIERRLRDDITIWLGGHWRGIALEQEPVRRDLIEQFRTLTRRIGHRSKASAL